MVKNFVARLKQAKLETKYSIDDFVKKNSFWWKTNECLWKISVKSNKELKYWKSSLNYHLNSFSYVINVLKRGVKLISKKKIVKNVINRYSIYYGGKFFFYVDQNFTKYFNFFLVTLFIYSNLKECQKKASNLDLQRAIVSILK